MIIKSNAVLGMFNRLTPFAWAFLALLTPAKAETIPNPKPLSHYDLAGHESFPYASVQGGVIAPGQLTGCIDVLGFLCAIENRVDLDTGFNAEVAFGYKYPDFRAEVALGYNQAKSLNQVNEVDGFGSISNPGQGGVSLYTLFASVYYDLPIWGAREGNQLLFRLSSADDGSSTSAVDTNRIEVWDPNADALKGSWVPYPPESFYRIPKHQSSISGHQADETVLVRVPLIREINSDNKTLILTVLNRAGMRGFTTADLLVDPSSSQTATPYDPFIANEQSGESPSFLKLDSLSPELRFSAPRSQAANLRARRPVIQVFPIQRQQGSPYAMFAVVRQQIRSRWSPYIGLGVGLGVLNTPGCAITNCTFFSEGTAQSFTVQAKAGISYRLNRNSSMFIEASYLSTGAQPISNVSYDPFSLWRLNVGWRQRL